MKIIITGGLGFIGQHLSTRLISDGHDIVLIDTLSPQIHGEIPQLEVPSLARVVRMDVCDLSQRYEIIEGADAVFHLAAETGTAQSMYEMSNYTRGNCLGTTALLEAIAKCTNRPKHIVLTSSRSVYGEGAYTDRQVPGSIVAVTARSRGALDEGRWEPEDKMGRPLTPVATPESFSFAPGSIYAATKAAQELFLTSASIALGIRTTIFRLQNVYGEGQSLRNPYTGIISIFFNRARQGLNIPIYEDGLESRDFVHVSDVVNALAMSLDADLPNGTIMNIGSGQPTTVSELASALLKASGYGVPVEVTGQYRLGDIRHCFADLSHLKKQLDFTPQISLADGLKSFCSWAISQPVHEDLSAKADAELRKRGLAS